MVNKSNIGTLDEVDNRSLNKYKREMNKNIKNFKIAYIKNHLQKIKDFELKMKSEL